jgi:hypothetical protein
MRSCNSAALREQNKAGETSTTQEHPTPRDQHDTLTAKIKTI